MIRVEISRAKWGRGEGVGSALKRVDNGLMCCLGFICKLAGISDEAITSMGYPSNLFKKETVVVKPPSSHHSTIYTTGPLHGQPVPELLQPLVAGTGADTFYSPEWVTTLARINDDICINDTDREARLIEEAAKHGFEFVFTE